MHIQFEHYVFESLGLGEYLSSRFRTARFGSVNKGVWTSDNGPVTAPVAIKTLKDEASEVETRSSSLREAKQIRGQFHNVYQHQSHCMPCCHLYRQNL